MAHSDSKRIQEMIEINREGNINYEIQESSKRKKEEEREWIKKLARKIGLGKNFIK